MVSGNIDRRTVVSRSVIALAVFFQRISTTADDQRENFFAAHGHAAGAINTGSGSPVRWTFSSRNGFCDAECGRSLRFCMADSLPQIS